MRLTNVVLPDSLKTISARAFYGCSNLQNIVIPASVQRMEGLIFKECYLEMNAWVESQLQSMTPEQRVAQLIVMAIAPSDDAATRALVKRYVEEKRVGGLIYSECNPH